MIVVYAVSRNIQTPQNLFDHPCQALFRQQQQKLFT